MAIPPGCLLSLIRHGSAVPPVLLRCPKYSAAYALNILTAAPNPARCFAHWARFAGFALWEGYPPGSWLTLIRHACGVPPSPKGRLTLRGTCLRREQVP